jgi:hypothetical protein
MAVLQILLAIFTRTAGRVLNTAFAWATIALFGRVPPRQQLYLSIMAFGSMAWLISAIGVAFPSVATFLLAFVTVPSWVRPGWIRLVMLLTSLTSPLLVGGLCLLALDPVERPGTTAARIKAALRGYPVTVGLSLTLAMLLVFVPILKVRAAMKRWTSTHVPVLVKPDAYFDVLHDLERALTADGWRAARVPASWTLRIPLRVFGALAGRSVPFVAERLTTLRADRLEVTLHPSDLILSGPNGDVMRARARLAERLAFSRLYMTWTTEAQCVEDALRKLWLSFEVRNGGGREEEGRKHAIEHELRAAEVSYEEWEVLFRKLLLLERHLAALDSHAPDSGYCPPCST